MSWHPSKTLLPEPFTRSNKIKWFQKLFCALWTLFATGKAAKKKQTVNDTETKVDQRPHGLLLRLQKNDTKTEFDGRPHGFLLRLQKLAADFFCTLSQDIRESYYETVKALRQNYNEKFVVFQGRLARRVNQLGEKLADFLDDLQTLAFNAYP